MIPKKRRLSKAVFKDIIEKGRYVHCDYFLLKTMSFNGQSEFAVSVPQKISKNVPTKNKLRRRVYSLLKDIIPSIKDGFRIILIMKEASLKASPTQISSEIKKMLGKLGFLK